MSSLYLIGTPIGNLSDITLRVLEILKSVDLICCEDTNQTKKLLNHYNIVKPLVSYHQHSKLTKIDYIIKELSLGKNIAVATDAGTPGISDQGNFLVAEVLKILGETVSIVPIPGVSAITTLASVSGVPCDEFWFVGFLPHKKGRQTLIKEIVAADKTVIFYESVHRIIKALEQLKAELTAQNLVDKKHFVIGRELTKMFETIYRGNINEVSEKISKGKIKGEFAVIISPTR